MLFPSLETERLLLTALQADDTAAVFNLFSNPAVVEFYDLDVFTDHSQATNLIHFFETRYQALQGVRWAIRLKTTGQLIGTCGFNSWSCKMHNAVIGYDLLPEFWHQGYAFEAVRAALEAGFSGALTCGVLHRVQADTLTGNQASTALLRRLGFPEEGLRRGAGYWKNKFHDLKCFGLLRAEFLHHCGKS